MLPGLAIIGVSNFGVQAGGSETPVFSLDICRTSRLFDWNMRTRDMHTVYDVEFRCSGSMRCLFHVALKAFESGPDHSWPLLLSFQNSACGHPPPTPPPKRPHFTRRTFQGASCRRGAEAGYRLGNRAGILASWLNGGW